MKNLPFVKQVIALLESIDRREIPLYFYKPNYAQAYSHRNIPDHLREYATDNWSWKGIDIGPVYFRTEEGWRIIIHKYMGEWDIIEAIISPARERLEFDDFFISAKEKNPSNEKEFLYNYQPKNLEDWEKATEWQPLKN